MITLPECMYISCTATNSDEIIFITIEFKSQSTKIYPLQNSLLKLNIQFKIRIKKYVKPIQELNERCKAILLSLFWSTAQRSTLFNELIIYNVSGLCVWARFQSAKADIITKVQLKTAVEFCTSAHLTQKYCWQKPYY